MTVHQSDSLGYFTSKSLKKQEHFTDFSRYNLRNIFTNIKENCCDDVNWIYPAQERF
jgi:hypothetical protein